MAARVRLILTLHNHQPIGNFDGVFENAYCDSYSPFLDVLEEFPELPVVLHISGSLLDWLADRHPEYVARVKKLVQRGQVELLGGPYYESILACIPRRDRLGQIRAYKQHLEQLFETQVRGMWVPERVWEQAFAGDIAEAGMEYTLLDDSHFRNAGLNDDELYGYQLTEEDGRLLKVFAGGERLRYLIPYRDPQETINYCREIAERFSNAVLVFGDDGEKFGVWPGSKDLVFRDQWLRRFFTALRDNRDWLQVTTMAETVDHVSPAGRCYLPDASYREMTEWALPTEKQGHFRHLIREQEQRHDWHRFKQFVRAGFWRNFLVKYPEANEMYSRMLQVSRRVEEESAVATNDPQAKQLIEDARRELYQAQCNCPYWHGAFGGLYLPHLRNAIYSKLITADTLLERAVGRRGPWVDIQADDFNLDARKELRLAGDRMIGYLAPGRGGHLYELDIRAIQVNLLATLNRRPEPYHDKIRQHAGQASSTGGGVDPNGGVCFKQPDLDQKLQYDNWPRKSLVDHFFQPGLLYDAFAQGHGELGDFCEGVYQSKLRRSADRVEACLWRDGKLGPFTCKLTKTVALSLSDSGTLDVVYTLENLPANVPIHFGVEFNFAAMPAGASDRYYYGESGQSLGTLDSRLSTSNISRFGLVDEWLGIDVALESSQPASFWTLPIQTVSQSESGFELVHQSCAVVPHWQFVAPADGRWTVRLCLSIDTTVSQARALADLRPVVREISSAK